MRIITALFVAVIGFGIAVFGVVRGLSSSGPAHGTRLILTTAGGDITLAHETAALRVEEKGAPTRVIAAGDRIVVELGTDDPQLVAEDAALLERTAHVELRDAEHPESPPVDAHALRHIAADDHGVTIDSSGALPFHVHSEVTFVLDGKIKLAATPDRVDGATMHVPMASLRQAEDLRALLVAGAAPAMHVESRTAFTRATGFWPRAWIFLAIGGVLLAVAAVLLLTRRPPASRDSSR